MDFIAGMKVDGDLVDQLALYPSSPSMSDYPERKRFREHFFLDLTKSGQLEYEIVINTAAIPMTGNCDCKN